MNPVKPYIYKEYPRTMHKPDGSTCTVRTDDEKAAKLDAGWNLLPEEPPPVLADPPPAADAGDIPKPRGRRKALVN